MWIARRRCGGHVWEASSTQRWVVGTDVGVHTLGRIDGRPASRVEHALWASSSILGVDLEKVESFLDPLPPCGPRGDLRLVRSGGWVGLVVLGAMD